MEQIPSLPVEVTTHNLYFHEESPIFSVDGHQNVIATCGSDRTIRLWKVHFGDANYSTNVYRTAANSSIGIEHYSDITGFNRAVNSVRIQKNDLELILAGCSDGGRVGVYKGGILATIRYEDGDDAYDLLWENDLLFVGFSSGNIEIFRIMENDGSSQDLDKQQIVAKLICKYKASSTTIQGLAYNKKEDVLAVHSLDKRIILLKWDGESICHLSEMKEKIDSSRSLFKRICFDDRRLFVFTKNNTVSAYIHPFTSDFCQMKIGPLDSGVVKAVSHGDVLVVCTRNSVYLFKGETFILSVLNACFMTITDAFVMNGTVFISSMDGFIATIRLDHISQAI